MAQLHTARRSMSNKFLHFALCILSPQCRLEDLSVTVRVGDLAVGELESSRWPHGQSPYSAHMSALSRSAVVGTLLRKVSYSVLTSLLR